MEQRVQVEMYEKDRRKHHECGNDIEVCGDPSVKFYPQRQVCRADMERAAAEWWYDELHKAKPFHDGTFKHWDADRSALFRYHYKDGVQIIATTTDLYPDDDFLERGQPAREPERLVPDVD